MMRILMELARRPYQVRGGARFDDLGEPAALGVRERLVNQACGFGELVAELANGADRAIEQSREGALVELVATERARDVFSCIARVRRNASGPFSNSVDSA